MPEHSRGDRDAGARAPEITNEASAGCQPGSTQSDDGLWGMGVGRTGLTGEARQLEPIVFRPERRT